MEELLNANYKSKSLFISGGFRKSDAEKANKKMNNARMRLWWANNWLKIVLVVLGIVCFVSVIGGLIVFVFALESYQQTSLVASLPTYFLYSLVGGNAS